MIVICQVGWDLRHFFDLNVIIKTCNYTVRLSFLRKNFIIRLDVDVEWISHSRFDKSLETAGHRGGEKSRAPLLWQR